MVSTRRSARGQPEPAAQEPPEQQPRQSTSKQKGTPDNAGAPSGTALNVPAAAAAAVAANDPITSPPSAKRQKKTREEPRVAQAADRPAGEAPAAAAAAPLGRSTSNGPSPAGDGANTFSALDGFHKLPRLRAALEILQTRVDDSAVFLRPSPEVALAAREVAKLLYEQCARVLLQGGGPGAGSRAARRALRNSAAAPLPNLHTDASFDPEQIWLQLELATETAVRRVRRLIRVAEPLGGGGGGGRTSVGLVTAEAAAGIDRLLSGGSGEEDDDDEGGGDEERGGSDLREDDDEDEDEEGEEEEEGEGRPAKKKARTEAGGGPKSEDGQQQQQRQRQGARLEDRFFRLSDLERYVEDAERRAMAGDDDDDLLGQEGEGEEEEEEDRDGLFGGMEDDDEDEAALEALLKRTAAAAGKKKGKDGAEIRYKDFFGAGGEGDEEDEDEEEGASEEDEDEEGGQRRSELLSTEDDGEGADDDENEAEGDDSSGAARRRSGKDAGPRDGGAKALGMGKNKDSAKHQQQLMSTHERRLARMQERVAELEAEALADKSWFLTGEATAASRPLNSALELDLDFETTAKPAPVQTDEMTNDLEAMIKKRIADRRFDDVVRIAPPPIETKKKEIELDDSKSKAGLGELYEQDYVRQVTGGTAEDKDEKLRQEAKMLFKALCGKLDALCRFHFAPKPVVEDMTIRSEVPAIAMEEAAPVAVSKAAMQLPGEVYTPANKDGRPVAEGELTREERKQRRSRKKRQRKAREEAKEAERRAKAVAAGGVAELAGRKSNSKVVAGKGVKVAEGAGAARHGRTDVGSSSAVFARLAAERAAAAGGVGTIKVARELKKKVGAAAPVGDVHEGGKKGATALKL